MRYRALVDEGATRNPGDAASPAAANQAVPEDFGYRRGLVTLGSAGRAALSAAAERFGPSFAQVLPKPSKSGISFPMMRAQNIFIVGPMGAGKSTVGRQLAETLSYRFKDSDQEIQRRTGVDIPTIFEYEGEEGFRQRERQVIQDLVTEERIVLATGGGAILSPDNRRDLSARGVVIYLQCSPEQQFARTARDRNRPLLDTADPLERLQTLMLEREPLYRQVADMVVSTEKRGTSSVVKEICRRLEAEEM